MFQEILKTSLDIMNYRFVFATAMHMYDSLDEYGLDKTNATEGSQMSQQASHKHAEDMSRKQDAENVQEA